MTVFSIQVHEYFIYSVLSIDGAISDESNLTHSGKEIKAQD